ncbi:MAG TPA: alpha/beta family hydrolase [Myxococcota bacterium]|nr:alpha/beta family hydrolase [Myxococcota bacterium]
MSDAPALRFDGPEAAALRLVLTHGAGAPVDDAFLEAITRDLSARGARVARFEFPYMAARRLGLEGTKSGLPKRRPPDRQPVLLDTWRAAVAALGGGAGLVIGGKSMGGRMASLVADEVGARGLVCLGYPFHPPGKPDRLRTAHLESLRTPTLIVQGERDAFGGREEVAGYELSPAIRLHWIADGDHSFAPRKGSGRTRAHNLAEAAEAVATFALGL